ncbi:MAG TPA: peptidase M28 family protein, partial [Flavisolibacter sp.]|nr:peptidase M28 family protein [Flavisolibacter sp.]
MKKYLLLLLGSSCMLASKAQQDDSAFIRKIANEILTHGKAYDDLRILTKQIGGRLSGSPQMVKAEQWGLKTLQAINPDKAWYQECMVPHWVRGGKDEATAFYQTANSGKTKESTHALDILALGNSQGSMKPIQANVIEVADFDDLEKKKDQVKDRIVFYNY